MSKILRYLRCSYIFILIALFYIPLFVAAIFSFNRDAKKGDMSFSAFQSVSLDGWNSLGDEHAGAIVNSLTIALVVTIIVLVLGLMVSYGLWRQKSSVYKTLVDGSSAIPLINPDIITAIGLIITFGTLFGELQFGDTGYIRVVIAHVTMILPFIITIMYPRSAKFKVSLIEASKDLGFGPIRTWFKTYFVYMIPVLAGSLVISMVLSLDDFIVTRLIFGGETIGSQLYSSSIKAWSLAIGTAMLGILACGGIGFVSYKQILKKIRQ